MSTTNPDWNGDRFRHIDTSLATLLRQLGRAVLAMALAFAASMTAWELLGLGRTGWDLVLECGIFVVFGCGLIYLFSARPIRRAIGDQRQAILDHEQVLHQEAERHQFSADLRDALEMAEDEPSAVGVVGRALDLAATAPTEMLLADHSRAHLHRAVHAAGLGDPPGCQVESPWGCPAVRRGQTLEFTSSEALAACPHLRGRPGGSCSAVCVPVTVLGNPMGVIHSAGPDGVARSHQEVVALEGIAMQAGSRIGVLRAMARSERQAATDPLTGQLNRRSFEEAVRRLREEGVGYALAVADLDHFKLLNDTYGHETGDKALRLFARTLRGAVRTDDIVCRYGGEEFVVVFPACTVVEAAAVVHRARAALASALQGGDVPAFTASYGLADTTFGDDLDDVLRLADAAMFRAKQAGRDRLVIADEDPPGTDPGAPHAAGDDTADVASGPGER